MKVVVTKALLKIIASSLAPLMLGVNGFALKKDLPISGSNVEINSTIFMNSEINMIEAESEDLEYKVSDVPDFYKDQIIENGIDESAYLSTILSLNIEIDNSHDLSWLSHCKRLKSLQINFLEKVDSTRLALSKSLESLKSIKISCLTTETFDSAQKWQDDQNNHKEKSFWMISHSGYNTTTKSYYTKYINNVELSEEMSLFLGMCPNIEELTLKGFSYRKTTDLSWISACNNLRSLTIFPYFDIFWDLNKEIPDLLSNLEHLSELTIRTNSYLMSAEDYKLSKETLSYLDYDKISFSGLTPNCFSYELSDGHRTLYIGSEDAVDFYNLPKIDKIDFSRCGIYHAAVYLDSISASNLVSNNIEIGLGEKYTLESLKNINSRLNKIVESLNISSTSSDREKLDKVLGYIFKTYTYPNLKQYGDIKTRFYKDGPLYGALNGREIICGNYASILCALLHRVGIESYYVKNFAHAWALIKIDSKYYYIDPTRLDSSYDKLVKKNMSMSDIFKSIHDLPMYLRDPDEIENKVLSKPNDELYFDSIGPYWILARSNIAYSPTSKMSLNPKKDH